MASMCHGGFLCLPAILYFSLDLVIYIQNKILIIDSYNFDDNFVYFIYVLIVVLSVSVFG